MTQALIRGAILAVVGASLAACETPKYPVNTNTTPAPPFSKYPITEPPPTAPVPAPAAAAQAAPAPPIATPTPATGQVSSQALPPLGSTAPAAPAVTPPPPAAVRPPVYTPPVYTPPPTATLYRPAPSWRTIAGGRVVAASGMFRQYQVQRGDHVDAIARDLGVTRKVIVQANRLKAPYALHPGESLKVPVDKAYVADAGDTMADVARRFGLTSGALADYNDLSTRGRLRPGERLALPAGFHDRGPTRERIAPALAARQSAPPSAAYAYVPPRPAYTPPPSTAAPYQPPSTGATPYRPPAYATAPYRPPAYAPPASASAPAPSPAQIAALAKGRFIWPLRGDVISGFGGLGAGRRNDGVDLRSPLGAPVRAAAAGEVVYAGDQVPGFGNLVLVKHADGWVTAYAHLAQVSVRMRQSVVQGEEIGQVGETGGASEPQLHFEVRYAALPTDRARPIDPLLVLPR